MKSKSDRDRARQKAAERKKATFQQSREVAKRQTHNTLEQCTTSGGHMNSWDATLMELAAQGNREAFEARMATIGFLKHFRYETLTTEQMLKILDIIKEER